ncbi:hypothetical protein HPB51_002723 [Rhipicephalus microplus]|uniref:Apple domain-containing protein n=1 Tax=Rhipicephalus microplus TaxID=6941 RepID=A0A9J6DLH9_RHIMP|nr:hypothetical protein HPB51_002723 [Rhipicephalus microplus]
MARTQRRGLADYKATASKVIPTARWAISEFRRGRALLQGTDAVDGIESVTWCFAACLKVPTCRAFNYGKGGCQMLQQELCHQAGLKLTADPRLNYYDLQERALDEVSSCFTSSFIMKSGNEALGLLSARVIQ